LRAPAPHIDAAAIAEAAEDAALLSISAGLAAYRVLEAPATVAAALTATATTLATAHRAALRFLATSVPTADAAAIKLGAPLASASSWHSFVASLTAASTNEAASLAILDGARLRPHVPAPAPSPPGAPAQPSVQGAPASKTIYVPGPAVPTCSSSFAPPPSGSTYTTGKVPPTGMLFCSTDAGHP
jgi:hypothetical protein